MSNHCHNHDHGHGHSRDHIMGNSLDLIHGIIFNPYKIIQLNLSDSWPVPSLFSSNFCQTISISQFSPSVSVSQFQSVITD